MSTRRQRFGRYGDSLARRHLEGRGYTVRETNYRTASGEIDLVAERDGTLAFVEVKARRSTELGTPEESLTPGKRAHLVAAAQEYLRANGLEDAHWRIDLVALLFDPRGKLLRLNLLENAVEL